MLRFCCSLVIGIIFLGVLPFGSLQRTMFDSDIEVPECEPPDYPEAGGYVPVNSFYVLGDFITYYCDPDAFLFGNSTRMCDFRGDWTGDTPLCDFPIPIRNATITPPTNSVAGLDPTLVHDGLRSTCLTTSGPSNITWSGKLTFNTKVYAIKIFTQWKYDLDFCSHRVRLDDTECSLRSRPPKNNIAKLGWGVYDCPIADDNSYEFSTYAKYVHVDERRIDKDPWRLCEVYVLGETMKSCTDPHIYIANGHLEISRKTATLICNPGYIRRPETNIECEGRGMWQRKQLYCSESIDL